MPIEQNEQVDKSKGLVAVMAKRFAMSDGAFVQTIKATCFPKGEANNDQLLAFLVVAREYELNPFTREIYAFPRQGGGIQPIVSIDGWLKLINSNPHFDGVEFEDQIDNGKLVAITCRIYRKDRAHATENTEYLAECARTTEPWQKWPRRMLRHKAMIQCARYAFGFAGIIDPDEAGRFIPGVEVERPVKMRIEMPSEIAAQIEDAQATEENLDQSEPPRLTEQQIDLIRQQIKIANLDESTCLKANKIEKWEDLSFEMYPGVLKGLIKHAEATKKSKS